MKEKYLDLTVAVLYVVALVVIYFFWGCKWDWIVTIIAVLVAAISITLLSYQNKMIKELGGKE